MADSLADFVDRQRLSMEQQGELQDSWDRLLRRNSRRQAASRDREFSGMNAASEGVNLGLLEQGNYGAMEPLLRVLMTPGAAGVSTPAGARKAFREESFESFNPLVEALLRGQPGGSRAQTRGSCAALGSADPAELNAMASKLLTQSGEMQPGENLADVLARGGASLGRHVQARWDGFQ